MKLILAAIHGILTRQTEPSWPDQLDAWMFRRDPEVKVLKKEYCAGPFPRWNCWVKDPLLARSLANELELFGAGARQLSNASPHPGPLPEGEGECSSAFRLIPRLGSSRTRETELPLPEGEGRGEGEGGELVSSRTTLCNSHLLFPPIWLVAHSNGAVIALLVTKRLIARGHRVGGLILTGAACEADVEKNGVVDWCRRGQLGAAIAYCSEDDAVVAGDARAPRHWFWKARDWLWGKAMWPYGCLGRTGWVRPKGEIRNPKAENRTESLPIFTRWYPGGHSTYFKPENRERTFEQIYQDMTTPLPPQPQNEQWQNHTEPK